MATNYPISAADILVQLNLVENQIATIMETGSIEAFAELNDGSTKISPKDFLDALYKRREMLQEQLKQAPYWIDHDVEGTI